MVEILLVLTLVAAISTVGLLAVCSSCAPGAPSARRAKSFPAAWRPFSQTLTAQMGSTATVQNAQFETLRGAVEQQLGRIQQDNSAKLEQMRQTVDEKLHATLEKRLSESFKQVSDRLEHGAQGPGRDADACRRGGRPQARAVQREDARRLRRNAARRAARAGDGARAVREERRHAPWLERARGVRDQAARQWRRTGLAADRREVSPGGLPAPPGRAGSREIYWRRNWRARRSRRGSSSKRGASPRSTSSRPIRPISRCSTCRSKGCSPRSFAGPGSSITSSAEWRVTICGPTNLLAYLNSLQMGFRTLAIQQRSSEVWKVLGTVKSEFGRFAEVLANTKRQLQTVANTIDQAEVRTRQIERKLKDVEVLPGTEAVAGRPAARRKAHRSHPACSQVATAPNGAATAERRAALGVKSQQGFRGNGDHVPFSLRFVVPLAPRPGGASPTRWCRSSTGSPSSGSCATSTRAARSSRRPRRSRSPS